jgi:hypothetical protein
MIDLFLTLCRNVLHTLPRARQEPVLERHVIACDITPGADFVEWNNIHAVDIHLFLFLSLFKTINEACDKCRNRKKSNCRSSRPSTRFDSGFFMWYGQHG